MNDEPSWTELNSDTSKECFGGNDSVMSRTDTAEMGWEYEVPRPPRDETKNEAENTIEDIKILATDGWRFVETTDYTSGGTKYLVSGRSRANDAEESS